MCLRHRWHTFAPEVLYWGPRLLRSIWQPNEIYITENSCAPSDEMAPDGDADGRLNPLVRKGGTGRLLAQ